VRRSVGRPSTGAVKWNIVVHTGRRVGRPKLSQYNADGTPKKRGRPSLSNKASSDKLSSPHLGRPKANNTSPKFAGDGTEEKPETLKLPAFNSTPKKRGRPTLTKC